MYPIIQKEALHNTATRMRILAPYVARKAQVGIPVWDLEAPVLPADRPVLAHRARLLPAQSQVQR